MASNLGLGMAGKTFIVGKSAVAYRNIYSDIFENDLDGVPRMSATLAGAIAQCTANGGDTIYLLPGHTETVSSATALAFNVAGINIVSLGSGANRATFTLDTAATAKIVVSVANVSVKNVIFIANFADIATCFSLTTAPGFSVQGCEFRDTSASLNFLAIVTTTVSVNADGLDFSKNRIIMSGTTAATTPIKVVGTLDRVTINDNFITKAVLNNTSCLLAHAALVVTNLQMARNILFSANTDSASGGFLITTSATTNTGMVHDNYIKGLDVAAEILVTAGSKYGTFNNLYNGDTDASGFVSPAIGSTS